MGYHVGIDLTDPDLFADGPPHDVYRFLRDEAPVYWHEPTPNTPDGEGFWCLTRHDDVVRWQSCLAEGARNIEIRGTHVGLLATRNDYTTLAHALTGEYDEPGTTWCGAVPAPEDLVPPAR